MKSAKKTVLLLLGLCAGPIAFSQCKALVKKHCLKELSPYVTNGQMNTAVMVKGEEADMELNFHKGLSYRVLVCQDPFFEGSIMYIKDQGDTLFSDTIMGVSKYQDIQVKESKTLQLQLKLPESKNTTGIVRDGCVSILIGFKE